MDAGPYRFGVPSCLQRISVLTNDGSYAIRTALSFTALIASMSCACVFLSPIWKLHCRKERCFHQKSKSGRHPINDCHRMLPTAIRVYQEVTSFCRSKHLLNFIFTTVNVSGRLKFPLRKTDPVRRIRRRLCRPLTSPGLFSVP